MLGSIHISAVCSAALIGLYTQWIEVLSKVAPVQAPFQNLCDIKSHQPKTGSIENNGCDLSCPKLHDKSCQCERSLKDSNWCNQNSLHLSHSTSFVLGWSCIHIAYVAPHLDQWCLSLYHFLLGPSSQLFRKSNIKRRQRSFLLTNQGAFVQALYRLMKLYKT